MPASSKRAKRVEKRNQYRKQTGQIKKAHKGAKRQAKFDTKNEPIEQQQQLSRKRFNPKDLCDFQPKTENQQHFVNLFDTGTDLLVAAGASGSGKSFLALRLGLEEVLDDSTAYDKVILIRSAVQTRDVGFLSGGLDDEKSQAFEIPYHGLCRDILPAFNEGYSHLKKLNYLEFKLTSFLRGETFHNAVVIVDEFQSMNYHELKTATERVGEHSRLILCGDTRQDDLTSKGKKSDKSGFDHYMKVLSNMEESKVGIVEFMPEDVVRSGLARDFIIADFNTGDE